MSSVTGLPSAVLLEILFPFLPVGSAVLLLQTAHFQDLPRAQFLTYVQTMQEHICYPFAAVLQFGLSVPPLSLRHRPHVFFDAWPEHSAFAWFDAHSSAAAPRPPDLAAACLWRAAARLLGIAPQQPGAFERFLQQDCGVTDMLEKLVDSSYRGLTVRCCVFVFSRTLSIATLGCQYTTMTWVALKPTMLRFLS